MPRLFSSWVNVECGHSASAKAFFSISWSFASSDSITDLTLQAGCFFGGVSPSSISAPLVSASTDVSPDKSAKVELNAVLVPA
jgi:hypothetical protein